MEQRSFFVSHLHDIPSGRMEVVVQEEAEDMVRRLNALIDKKISLSGKPTEHVDKALLERFVQSGSRHSNRIRLALDAKFSWRERS